MKNSLKQLFRTPAKSLLFFLLTVIATVLLTVGSVLYVQSSQRMADVESSFTTLGMVRQVPIKTVTEVFPRTICTAGGTVWREIWGHAERVDVLNFEGAEYLTLPESRPYYIADVPALSHVAQMDVLTQYQVVQAVALESTDSENPDTRMQVEKVLATYDDGFSSMYNKSSVMSEGKIISVCQHSSYRSGYQPLEKGKSYVFSCYGGFCPTHELDLRNEDLDCREYAITSNPYCSQFDKDGNALPTDYFANNSKSGLMDEVTADFWKPGGHGEKWEYWVHYKEKGGHWFTIAPVNDLQLLPVFQNHHAFLSQGREITAEEFETGALVCMLPDNVFAAAGLQLGDKISMSMLCSAYGAPGTTRADDPLWSFLSPFNAQGDYYEPFYEAEYEIVGTYDLTSLTAALNKEELSTSMVVIPAKSVTASDENNISYFGTMKPAQTTFLLPNGTIDAFETALREAVPDLAGLEITYNDNGYEEIMGSLRSVWITSILLFAVGLFAALATLLLLLYFFVVKQKKRTAIERSLGMSKRQCRVSLISGILVLTLLATDVGSAVGAVLVNNLDLGVASAETAEDAETMSSLEETEAGLIEDAAVESLENGEDTEGTFEQFSTKFSLWATESNTVDYTGSDVTTPVSLFFVIPLAMLLIVLVLSLLLTNRNLKIEPIYLLSSKID